MATKISSYVNLAVENGRTGVKSADGVASKKEAAPASTAVSTGKDSVDLTADALQLSQLEARIAQIPVADHARVAQVRQAIADGTYQVDAQKIASRMARMEWDLGAL